MAQTQTDVERKRLQRERTAKHRAKVQAESANNLAANEQKSRDQFEAWESSPAISFAGGMRSISGCADLRWCSDRRQRIFDRTKSTGCSVRRDPARCRTQSHYGVVCSRRTALESKYSEVR